MTRDPLFYSLFEDLPSCFFQLVGRSDRAADSYQLEAIEYKSTAVRLDGLFRPIKAGVGPAYIWEVQYYLSDKVYANLMTKIGRFLEHGDPAQDWAAVVIYPNRSLEQKNLEPYRCLVNSDQLVRIYLDELPPASPEQFEMGILELIAAKPEAALEKARAMVPRVRESNQPPQFQRMLLQFIETIIVHQFPNWSREEIETMLQVTDVRQTRVFQEAREEGMQEGLERGLEKGIEQGVESVARRLLDTGHTPAETARLTGLALAQVRKLTRKSKK
jgi:predicted transposase/invertase (TIGR01784 family)